MTLSPVAGSVPTTRAGFSVPSGSRTRTGSSPAGTSAELVTTMPSSRMTTPDPEISPEPPSGSPVGATMPTTAGATRCRTPSSVGPSSPGWVFTGLSATRSITGRSITRSPKPNTATAPTASTAPAAPASAGVAHRGRGAGRFT